MPCMLIVITRFIKQTGYHLELLTVKYRSGDGDRESRATF